jgi:Putative zinc-finger
MIMREKDIHLSDQELLLYADGELSPYRAAQMREHLAACWTCRARATELEGAIADFVHFHQGRVNAQTPRSDGLRSSLKAKLAVAATEQTSRVHLFPGTFWRQAACACIALLIVTAFVWKLRSGYFGLRHRINVAMASALPDRTLTPGYTRPVKLSDLCGSPHAYAPPAEDESMEQTVFHEYGLPVSTSKSYELDYLITPELGGADDVRNLWPEPYGSTDWNAHVKDELEDRLHTMVCDGQIDLATAQRDIATDWIAAYKRYFHTEAPLPNPENVTMSRLAPDAGSDRRARVVLIASRLGFWPIS